MTNKTTIVNLDDVEYHPQNPRKGSTKKITESMRAHGFVNPIVIQKSTNRVLSGNHSVKVAKKLKIREVPAVIVDFDDDQAMDYMLMVNASTDGSGYDETLLSEAFKSRGDRVLEGTGYTGKQVEVIHARAAWQDEEDVVVNEPKTKAAKGKTGTTKIETPQERVRAREANQTRSFVIPVPLAKHPALTMAMAKVRKQHKLRDNWQVIATLLKDAGHLPEDFEIKAQKKGKKK